MSIYHRAIQAYYGDRCAKRSGVPLMNHINEGLKILCYINAEVSAMQAFCIHPLIQADDDLQKTLENHVLENMNPEAVALAMEYRRVANAYLSFHCKGPDDVIALSPLKAVNDMLIADKVQNRKDFLRYHYGTHEHSAKLDLYFQNWLKRLGISENRYKELCTFLQVSV